LSVELYARGAAFDVIEPIGAAPHRLDSLAVNALCS
jgi:hypothetical protein